MGNFISVLFSNIQENKTLLTELRTGGIAGMDLPLWDLSEQQMQLRVNIKGVLVWGPLG